MTVRWRHGYVRRAVNARRPAVTREPESQQFVDDLLAELRAGSWSPRAWAQFLARSAQRSLIGAHEHPRAAAETTALHALASLRGHWWWSATSWALAMTHLGLLGDSASLGWANRLTMVRGLLPAAAKEPAPWLAAVALASDWADGRLARATAPTAFGFYADALADASFWTWFVLRHEPSRAVRAVAVAAWSVPPVAVTAVYLARGRTTDYPRPLVVRNASVALQVMVSARALAAAIKSGHRGTRRRSARRPAR